MFLMKLFIDSILLIKFLTMKKFLLLAAVAIVAMSANAQKVISMDAPMSKANLVSPMQAMTSVVYKNNPMNKNVAKADAQAISLIDAGIDSAGPDGDEIEIVSTDAMTLTPTEEANVYQATFGSSEWKVTFDGETLTIPVNQTFNHATYGEFLMLGIIEKEDGLYLDDENDIVYTLNPENGKYECSCVGWYIYMNEGDYEGSCWSRSFYSELMVPNGVENGSLGKGGWSEYSNPIFVEDLGDEINVYNFFGYTKLNILVDEEEGYLLIPMHQPIMGMSSSYDNDVYGYWFRLLGVGVDEEGYLYVDEEKDYTEAYFAAINEAGDALVRSENSIITDPTRDGYMGIFSEFDAEGQGYYMGYLHSVNFTLNEGKFKFFGESDGIKDVVASSKDNKFFNLCGQQVSANAKGIIIANGKKYLVK